METIKKAHFPGNIEGIFVEINLRKTKWLSFGRYRPPQQQAEYFLKHVNYVLDTCRPLINYCLLDILTLKKQILLCLKFYLIIIPKI